MLVSYLLNNLKPTRVLQKSYHKIGVIGVPFNKGQNKNGVERGPAAIRETGVLEDIKSLNIKNDIKDYGDVVYEVKKNVECNVNNMKNWAHISECNRELSLQVQKVIKDNRVCLTLGGDHSIGIGSIHGHAKACFPKKVAILWIDAHTDINNNEKSSSGHVHGMSMSLLLKELRNEWSNIPLLDWFEPVVSVNNIAYIALRSVDPYEKHIIDKYNITAFDMKDVQQCGIHNIIKMALRKIDPDQNCSLHLSFDIDSLDKLEAPSTGTPVRGGLTLREAIEIVESASETNRLQAFDFVEVNPLIGNLKDAQTTLEAAAALISAAFGNYRMGVKYDFK